MPSPDLRKGRNRNMETSDIYGAGFTASFFSAEMYNVRYQWVS
jgi:hypothetical protein